MAGRETTRTLAPISTPNLPTNTTMTSSSPSPLSPPHRTHHHPSPTTPQPQWTHQETVALIAVRGELERDFSTSKRNKSLWETVASRMKEMGFGRTPHQCKCKWKNLLIRYKGKETLDPLSGKQCPFYEELHAVFVERERIMQQTLMESQQEVPLSQPRKRMKTETSDQFSDYLSQEGVDEENDSEDEIPMKSTNIRKRKTDPDAIPEDNPGGEISRSSSIEEMLRVFFQQQERIEMQWREAIERHRHERELFEQDWRLSMEKLERERLVMEKEWQEREEEWKTREEIRAEKMDALLTKLLSKLISEEDDS